MNKVYKGYELIKEIAEGNIKEDTKVKCIKNNQIYRICYNNILMPEEGEDFIENDFGASLWLNFEFELIEDQTIDIDSIEKLDDTYSCYFHDSKTAWNVNEQTLALKINKLIDAVQHLNKEIQSIKEKQC